MVPFSAEFQKLRVMVSSPPEDTVPVVTDRVAVRTGGLLRTVTLGLNVVPGCRLIE